MSDLDDHAASYLAGLDIPPGPGVTTIAVRGRRRLWRQRLISAGSLAAVGAVMVVIGSALATPKEPPGTTTATDDSAAPAAPPGSPIVVDLDDELLRVLDDRDDSKLPTVPWPTRPGWTTEMVHVTASPRPGDDQIAAIYRLRSVSDEEVRLKLLPGQANLNQAGDQVEIQRPSGPVNGALRRDGDMVQLQWNQGPGLRARTGLFLTAQGESRDAVLAAAEAVTFSEQPLTGGIAPEHTELPTGRVTLMSGTTSGVEWQVSRFEATLPVLEIDGMTPTVSSDVSYPGSGSEVRLDSISNDGVQINMIQVPMGATAELAGPDGARVPLPLVAVEGTTYSIAVAPIPAGKRAPAVVVRLGDSETNVALPVIPPDGWVTSAITYTPER